MIFFLVPHHGGDQVVLAHLGHRGGQHQLTVPEHGDIGADLEDLLEVVGDVHDRHAGLAQLADALEQAQRRAALEGRGGLVEQQAAGARGQRPGDLDDLPLLDGEAAAGGIGVHVEAPVGHDLPGLLAHLAPVDDAEALRYRAAAARLAAEEDVLRHGEAGHHHGMLEYGRDARAPGGDIAERGRGLAVEGDLARIRCGDAAQDGDQRGLARAVAAHQAEAPAGVQAQPDAAQGVRAAEPLMDPRRARRRDLGGERGRDVLLAHLVRRPMSCSRRRVRCRRRCPRAGHCRRGWWSPCWTGRRPG